MKFLASILTLFFFTASNFAIVVRWEATCISLEGDISYPIIPLDWTVTATGDEILKGGGSEGRFISILDGTDSAEFIAPVTTKATAYVNIERDGSGPSYTLSLNGSALLSGDSAGATDVWVYEGNRYTLSLTAHQNPNHCCYRAYGGIYMSWTEDKSWRATNTMSGRLYLTAESRSWIIDHALQIEPTHGGTIDLLACSYSVQYSDPRVYGGIDHYSFYPMTDYTEKITVSSTNIAGGFLSLPPGGATNISLPFATRYSFKGSFPPPYLGFQFYQDAPTEPNQSVYVYIKDVASNLRILSKEISGAGFKITWQSLSGLQYEIQRSTELGSAADWKALGIVEATGDQAQFLDENPSNQPATSYYRIQIKELDW